jgi:hypothetical protein
MEEIITILDRLIGKMGDMEKRIDGMIEKMNEMTTEINNVSSEQTTDEDYLSSVMYGVDNKQ